MRHIDYGLGVFHQSAFESIPEQGSFDLADLYRQLLERGELAGLEIRERFYETGSFNGIQELAAYLAKRHHPAQTHRDP
jgi:N-acetyl-alpha-D-muramate 1-phosphate uridylyltransferase